MLYNTQADPSLLHTIFPVWVQDRIEENAGLNDMMKNVKMDHANGVIEMKASL
jgi:hypothetical protein